MVGATGIEPVTPAMSRRTDTFSAASRASPAFQVNDIRLKSSDFSFTIHFR
jgi:hypothetical protein